MSAMRCRYRVAWDDGEPVEITTNAWDMSAAGDHAKNEALARVAIVHHALERLGHPVPPFRRFMDVLDELFLLDAQGRIATGVDANGNPIVADDQADDAPQPPPEPVEPDPTPPAPGPDEPLPSRSSPALTGAPGSITPECS